MQTFLDKTFNIEFVKPHKNSKKIYWTDEKNVLWHLSLQVYFDLVLSCISLVVGNGEGCLLDKILVEVLIFGPNFFSFIIFHM